MPEALPGWAARVPLGIARARLVAITRRGVGMTLASAAFWLAVAGVARFAGLDPTPLGVCFLVGGALVYPAGWLCNRAFGGDLTARGSELRGLVGALTVGQMLGWPLLVALLWLRTDLVAFALAASLGAHFLPYGWLYRAPAYHALGVASVATGAALQAGATSVANVAIPAAMAALYLAAGIVVWRQNRRDAADARISASAC
ncbi:DUF7010 family protein [Cognatilysobacter segetis]|uniref:DUF7010 family protein n=1 Tax=Cognatilysobacter segetis TaxID=2492394 RepID=UPI00105CD76F|nr:hypothetical protein [Lysobacter segetis]